MYELPGPRLRCVQCLLSVDARYELMMSNGLTISTPTSSLRSFPEHYAAPKTMKTNSRTFNAIVSHSVVL